MNVKLEHATLFTPSYGVFVDTPLSVRQGRYRKLELRVEPYAQHPLVVTCIVVEPKKRTARCFMVTPSDSVPAFAMAVRGHVTLELPVCSVFLRSLSGRPHEWPEVRDYYHRVSELIASQCDVAFDWRTTELSQPDRRVDAITP
jgi:hypothetical protein